MHILTESGFKDFRPVVHQPYKNVLRAEYVVHSNACRLAYNAGCARSGNQPMELLTC
jgi:hypothetical protein